MKLILNSEQAASANRSATEAGRFQIQRRSHTGNYTVELTTNSTVEAIESFLALRPAFEGGEVRIWNLSNQCASAWVEWIPERTDFGFAILHRVHVFGDREFVLIERQVKECERMRALIWRELENKFSVQCCLP